MRLRWSKKCKHHSVINSEMHQTIPHFKIWSTSDAVAHHFTQTLNPCKAKYIKDKLKSHYLTSTRLWHCQTLSVMFSTNRLTLFILFYILIDACSMSANIIRNNQCKKRQQYVLSWSLSMTIAYTIQFTPRQYLSHMLRNLGCPPISHTCKFKPILLPWKPSMKELNQF